MSIQKNISTPTPNPTPTLKVNEIFDSLSGEIDGWASTMQMATFVRLQGCNLRCNYCDTPKALKSDFNECHHYTPEQIEKQVHFSHVIITGGEPLLQFDGTKALCKKLYRPPFYISIETNGSIPLQEKLSNVKYCIDYKLTEPSEYFKAFEQYKPQQDVLKCVVKNMDDVQKFYEIWKQKFMLLDLQIALSPVMYPQTIPFYLSHQITDFLRKQRLNWTLSLQQHKIIGIA